VGFVTALLERALGTSLGHFGVHVSNGGGHETSLELLQALKFAGLNFGGFADNEDDKHPTRWKVLADSLGRRLFRWPQGGLEENVLAVHGEL
jgi:putative ATP-dependent endonuclease of the OLD family